MFNYADTEVSARSNWLSYVALFRFHYHCSFVGVLLGSLIVTRHWSGILLWRTFLLYVSLNVLLYGGLYALNAITDAEADSRHPLKHTRPVASGEISRKTAGVFAAGLIVAGFVTGWVWLGAEILPVYVLFLVLNLSYSLCFRNLFVLDVIFNSATHPPRFWLGMWLAGGGFAMGVARSGVPVCNWHVRQPALGRSKSWCMEITSITSKILKV